MRKIEQRMVNAINNKVNYRESNTEVIVKGANVFVRLYDTYIYICINWNSFMSSFVNMLRVKQIASYLRKFTSLPIYDAYCNVY